VIEAVHTYPDSPSGTPYVAILTVTSGSESASGTYRVVVRDASLNVRVNVAIDDGLWWLHKRQSRYSSGGIDYGYWTDSSYSGYRISASSNAVLAFEIQGHQATGDPNVDPYVETVRRGLNYVFSRTRVVTIGPQPAGDPDTNGNGIGVGVSSNREPYELGMVMMALAASGDPNLVAATGPANVVGHSYRDILTDMVDLCAWGQNEYGNARGGWRYYWNYSSSDNSVSQWPIIGLEAAEANWGIVAPAFVKSELDIWLAYSQNASGGFGYHTPTYWVNVAKTGAGIAGLNYVGLPNDAPRVVNALNYLNSRWGSSGTDGYWGNYYALYAVMKGMATARPSPITHIGSHDWYTEFANYLVNAQRSDGDWPSGSYGGNVFDTSWALLILSPTVFTPPPVADAGPDVVGGPHPEYPAATLDGSGSYHLNPDRRIVAYTWNFGDGLPAYTETENNAPDGNFDGITTHAYTALGEYTATLTVTDDDPTAPQSASDTTLVRITPPDHPPVADPGGPYQGYFSIPALGVHHVVTLDGSSSYDINEPFGDSIVEYGWELDGIFPYDFDDALGETVQWTWDAPGTYNIGLKVTDTDLFAGGPMSDIGWTQIVVGEWQCEVSPHNGLDACQLQPGDILQNQRVGLIWLAQAKLFGGYWGHTAMYLGQGYIVESYAVGIPFVDEEPGVVTSPIAKVDGFWDASDWAILRVKTDEGQKAGALEYGTNQRLKPYNWLFPDKWRTDKYYCTQLVWRSYEQQSIDLDSDYSVLGGIIGIDSIPLAVAKGLIVAAMVTPDDIFYDDDVDVVAVRSGAGAALRRAVLYLFSPADFYITDPEGRHIGVDPATGQVVNEIPDAFYSGPEADPEIVKILDMEGAWTVQVVGTDTGPYNLVSEVVDPDPANHVIQVIEGTTSPGVVTEYEATYPSEPGEPIELMLVNTPPLVDAGPDQTAYEGDTFILALATFTDPDLGDTHTATIDWGDGLPPEAGIVNESDGSGTVSGSHVYGDDGSYTVMVAVCDDDDACGEDSFTVIIDNVPPEVSADPAAQQVQYSDPIAAVIITASDMANDPLQVVGTSWSVDGGGFTAGLPPSLTLTDGGCTVSGNTNTCTWALSGIADVAAGTYTVRVTVADDDGGQTDVDVTIVVEPEDATVGFDDDNSVAVRVAEPGGNSGPFSLTVYVSETQPDQPVDSSAPGDISLAGVSVSLVPVGPGSPVDGACTPGTVTGSGYDALLPVTCGFDGVAVNAYTVQVEVSGGYYTGSAEDVLTVYDPSLGFATGGGWFYWPGTGERTNFGFTMKYNKKGEKVKGNFLLIRHLPDGSIYRVKSNALYGLALGESSDPAFGWASFSGKSTYLEPGWPEPEGNYEFLVYVEDRDEPGTGVDRFWIEVKDKDRALVPAMSMDREATDNAVELHGGNIAVPHGGKK
jgi:uncharacterized protein YycO